MLGSLPTHTRSHRLQMLRDRTASTTRRTCRSFIRSSSSLLEGDAGSSGQRNALPRSNPGVSILSTEGGSPLLAPSCSVSVRYGAVVLLALHDAEM